MAERFEFQFSQVSHRLNAAQKQCPHANLMFVVLALSCCASARLDIVHGYHLADFHTPLGTQLLSQVCKFALYILCLCRLILNNTLKSVVKLMITLLAEQEESVAII